MNWKINLSRFLINIVGDGRGVIYRAAFASVVSSRSKLKFDHTAQAFAYGPALSDNDTVTLLPPRSTLHRTFDNMQEMYRATDEYLPALRPAA